MKLSRRALFAGLGALPFVAAARPADPRILLRGARAAFIAAFDAAFAEGAPIKYLSSTSLSPAATVSWERATAGELMWCEPSPTDLVQDLRLLLARLSAGDLAGEG